MKQNTTLSLLLLLAATLLLAACTTTGDVPEEQILVTREPLPEVDEDLARPAIDAVVTATGLDGRSFLGLSADQWVSIAFSVLIVVVGYIIGTWVIHFVLSRITRRYFPEAGQEAAEALGPPLRWLIVTLAGYLAIVRLTFIAPGVRRWMLDVLFLIGVVLVTVMAWRLLDIILAWIRQRPESQDRHEELDPALLLFERFGRVVIIVVATTIVLSHFGINLTALTAALGVGALAFSLAARDTIADAIAGVIILFDRPFRLGDRIEIQEIDTWGDVVDIGLRTTRIRTRDNRLVIVPNSLIASNQIINYTYPDPRYRIETHVSISYSENIEHVRKIIIDAVRQVDGVLPDLPVEALYIEMGDSAMIFRVRWWIETYVDTRRMFDSVNTSLQHALDEEAIVVPIPEQKVIVQTNTPDV